MPGTTILPLQREKPRVRNALWNRLPPPGSAGSWSHLQPSKVKDEDEEMPRALQDRMGVRAADSSSIPGKAKGTRLRCQEGHGQPTPRLPQPGSVHRPPLAPPRHRSPSCIPGLKSYPGPRPKSCDHHSSQSTQALDSLPSPPSAARIFGWIICPGSPHSPRSRGGMMTPWAADFPTPSLTN